MALVAGVTAEGLLCRSEGRGAPFGANLPIPVGVRLLRALSGLYRVAVVTDEPDVAQVEGWLALNGLEDNYGHVVGPRPDATRASQWAHLRAGGGLDLVVDPSPADVATALSQGISALLFTHPQYARPEWRPDDHRGARAWGDIEAEIETQALRKVSDRRLTSTASGRYEDE